MKTKKIAGMVLAELKSGNTYILVYDVNQSTKHEISDLLRELGHEFSSKVLAFGVNDTAKAIRFVEIKPGDTPDVEEA